MGIFSKANAALGGIDHHLIETGTLARGNVLACETTAMSTGRPEAGLGTRVVCKLTVQVVPLDGGAPYEAHTTHPIPQVYLPQFMSGQGAVAVRVDPADPQHIALDLTHDVPPAPGAPEEGGAAQPEKIMLVSDDGTKQELKTSQSTYTAAEILAQGSPCTVQVLAVIPLNQLASDGGPATGLVLQVHRDGIPDYQAQIGTHIPDAALPKVVVGATLPAKWVPGPGLPTDVNLVSPDWSQIA